MEILDLHGVRHHRVELLVENFILLNDDVPLKIITGNSPTMQSIVHEVLERYGFSWCYESDYNLGAIVVNAS